MKEILIRDVPEGATVLIAHDLHEGAVFPQDHILEIFHHNGGDLFFQYNNYRRLFIRVRHYMWKQMEVRTMDIPMNNIAVRTMMRDLVY